MKRILSLSLVLMLALGLTGAMAIGSDLTVTAQTHVGNFGREAQTFTISGIAAEDAALVKAEDFIISKDYINPANTVENTEDVTAVEVTEAGLVLTVSGFRYNPSPFVVTYTGDANVNLSFTKEQVAEVSTAIADEFVAGELDNMKYRLYIPEGAEGPLPMVIWHHGGGSIGTDNIGQVVNLLGATPYIEKYGDVVVLAPQCQRFDENTYQDWTEIIPAIRKLTDSLIADGTVDATRVYGTGCSFGGYGVIMDAAANPDLFAAINVQCPMLNAKSVAGLLTLTEMPVYLTTAEHDGTLPYATQDRWLIEALQNAGNENALIYVFSDEEMNAYGIGSAEGLTDTQIGSEMHNSWVLSFNNEQGVMDWIWDRHK